MIKFKGAYETTIGNVFCENCGSPMKNWEKMATEDEGRLYVFRCRKCKKRIEAYNDRANKMFGCN